MVVNNKLKQVIVMRNDLNMRKGKMVAQGAHASVLAYKSADNSNIRGYAKTWFNEGMTKITVRVDSEGELLDVVAKAKSAGLTVELVRDAGLTEFKEPTLTCCAIGPGTAEDIDKITGHLKLL